ncbi:nucleotidyl transferase AbiEii/AbiGii toxin family protein [Sphingobacterium bovisgrunnientis]|uniref:nucleotidyl transferase AbiEii/AbiGii toxin family protein n=1 Tax=Sphingobacterium bovisgrunnientis TaxID=1874697 RepID=UPI001358CB73|nr:nucleotidyl transferase AbiEii/AbiGii toxin family protein [Sphingobacterium bovisgrunnientis]
MSDNHILLPLVSEMLTEMSTVCSKFGIDFYLVGAIARDIHLSANEELLSKRRTKDVDLAITISDQGQYNQVKASLIATGLFEGHESEAIKLIYKKGIEVDLLPFGEIEQPDRNVRLTDPTFVLNMPGFTEVYPFVKDHDLGNGQIIKICTIEGIILLKLIANDDRPERTKDIADIDHLIQSYFDLNDDDIYMLHYDILELYDTNDNDYIQLVCSRLIGRKIGHMLSRSGELADRVRKILAKRETNRWHAMLMGLGED